MSIRINGYVHSSRLGYFYGDNALVSIAVDNTGDVTIADTGAVCSYAELLRVLNTTDTAVIVAWLEEQGIVTADGAAWSASTVEAQYIASYAAQTNLKRIVDIVQQRAVVLGTSSVAHGVAVTGFSNIQSDAVTSVSLTAGDVVTFLVERANVFDKDGASFQGVPSTTTEVGRNLLNDLTGVPMLTDTGIEVSLASAAGVAVSGNFGISVMKQIPAIY